RQYRLEIGIRWCRIRRLRMLAQLLHQIGDGAFELRIVPRALGLRIVVDVDIRRDAAVLDFPIAFQSSQRPARRGDGTAVDQRRITADADKSAPGAFADQRTDLVAL